MSRLGLNAIRYAIVGVLNSAVGFAIIAAILHVAPSRAILANAAGFGVGFLISFVLNKSWTFSDRRPFGASLAPYVALVAACYLANLAVVILAGRIPGLGVYWPQLLGMATYTLLLFCGSHFVVFKGAHQ